MNEKHFSIYGIHRARLYVYHNDSIMKNGYKSYYTVAKKAFKFQDFHNLVVCYYGGNKT